MQMQFHIVGGRNNLERDEKMVDAEGIQVMKAGKVKRKKKKLGIQTFKIFIHTCTCIPHIA